VCLSDGGEGVDEMEDGGAQKNPKIDIIQLFSLAFLKYPKSRIFWKGKTPTPTGFSTSFSFVTFQDLSPIRNCHESSKLEGLSVI
jgi:hypothetical protein